MTLEPFVTPPTWTVVAFVALVLIVQVMLLIAVHRTGRGAARTAAVAVAFALVMLATAGLARSEWLAQDGLPPRLMVYFAAVNGGALALALAPAGRALVTAVPVGYWLLFQGFRLPLEVVLHAWGEAGTIPPQMTWSGENLDVISGVICPLAGATIILAPRARWAGWLGHAVGGLLLLNVARVAALSGPTPFKAFDGPALQLPFHVPYTWIVPFAVGAALFTHVVGLRALWASRNEVGRSMTSA